MKYTVYQITNKLNGKIYIGKHQTEDINDSYFGSGKAITDAIIKHGKENFVKEILFVFDTEDEMNVKECELVNEEFVSRRDTYNLGVGGEGGPHFKGKTHTKETMERIKEKIDYVEKGRILSKRYIEGELVVWNKNKKQADSHNKKISEARQGKKHSLETIEKIKTARKKQVFSDETKRKMAESAKNRSNTSGPID